MATVGSDSFVGYNQYVDISNINFASAGPGGFIDATNATFVLPLPGIYLFQGSVRGVVVLATGATGAQLMRLYDVDLDAAVSGSLVSNTAAVATLAPTMDSTVGYNFVYEVEQPTTVKFQLGLLNAPSTYTSAVTGAAASGSSNITCTLLQIVGS